MKSLQTTVALFAILISSFAMQSCMGTDDGMNVEQSKKACLCSGCGFYFAPIFTADYTLSIGSVRITNTTENLVLMLASDVGSGWRFENIKIYAGLDNVPTDGSGNVDPTQFTNTVSFPAPTYGFYKVVEIPLTDILPDLTCGQLLNMAIYADMVRVDKNTGEVLETGLMGWAKGEDLVSTTLPKVWGKKFHYEFCCGDTFEGCTRTQGYWKTHSKYAKQKKKRIDWSWEAPLFEDALLCPTETRTNFELLRTPPAGGNAYLILAHQYIAAQLNQATGASSTTEVDDALSAALPLLQDHCGTSVHASTADGQLMVILGEVLDGYNNGFTGPGHCAKGQDDRTTNTSIIESQCQ